MIVINTLNEAIALAPRVIKNYLIGLIIGELHEGNDTEFNSLLGGKCHICECIADLALVVHDDAIFFDKYGRDPNIMDLALGWDVCEYYDNYFLFFLVTNDAGGDFYYVPYTLWDLARVEEHYIYNNQEGI